MLGVLSVYWDILQPSCVKMDMMLRVQYALLDPIALITQPRYSVLADTTVFKGFQLRLSVFWAHTVLQVLQHRLSVQEDISAQILQHLHNASKGSIVQLEYLLRFSALLVHPVLQVFLLEQCVHLVATVQQDLLLRPSALQGTTARQLQHRLLVLLGIFVLLDLQLRQHVQPRSTAPHQHQTPSALLEASVKPAVFLPPSAQLVRTVGMGCRLPQRVC